MTEAKQVLLKLGVDTTQVGPATDGFMRKVSESSGHAHNSIMHVESAGRAFKKVLHSLTEESPLLGIAIRAAINPVVAIIIAAAMAFKELQAAQKKAAEEAKKEAKEVRDAWWEAQQVIFAKDPRKAAAERSKREAGAAVKAERDARGETVSGQVEEVPIAGWLVKAGRWAYEMAGGKKSINREAEIDAQREAAARGTGVSSLRRSKNLEDKEEQLKTEEKIEKIQDESRKLEARAAEKSMTKEQKLNALLKERADLTRSGMDMGEDQLSQAEAELELNKIDLKIEEQKKDIKDHNLKVEKERATLNKDLERVNRQIANNARKEGEDELNKHRMTHDQLLGQGTWWTNKLTRRSWFQPSPLARLEEYSQRAGNESGIQSALLHPEAAKYWAAESKRTRMLIESTGAVKTETLEAENSKNITRLTELAQRDGFLVRLKDLDNE